MKIQDIRSENFNQYGFVLEGYDFTEAIETLESVSEKPSDHVIYVPGCAELESLAFGTACTNNFFGGMPIQVGYCNGYNKKLNCLEYHRGAELNVAADDVVLLVAPLQKMNDGALDTSEVEAFLLPAGTGVLLHETTLHYAPCCAETTDSFRVIIVLPKGTNTEKPPIDILGFEDK